jgi:pentatricopeptide repeat protein
MDEVMKIFHAMMSAGLQPNVVVYGTLVNSYCKTGRIDDALNLFHEMSLKGIRPTDLVYKIILHELFQAGRVPWNDW